MVEARRVSPTIDQNAYMYMYTLKYIIERGEERRVGEQLAAVKAMTGVLPPWSPRLNTIQTCNHINNSLG